MAGLKVDSSYLLLGLIVLLWFVKPSHAFGAGNIASGRILQLLLLATANTNVLYSLQG